MDTNDFERAKGALAQSLNVAGPILTALQQAGQVFDVLTNATVHKAALEREVTELSSAASEMRNKLKTLTAQIATAEAKAVEVEAEAARCVREAEAIVPARLAAIEDELSVKIAEAQAEATTRLQEIAAVLVQNSTEFDAATRDLAVKQAAAEAEYAAVEKKLAAIKASAQKFTASLLE